MRPPEPLCPLFLVLVTSTKVSWKRMLFACILVVSAVGRPWYVLRIFKMADGYRGRNFAGFRKSSDPEGRRRNFLMALANTALVLSALDLRFSF
jgi:hypothetical protein